MVIYKTRSTCFIGLKTRSDTAPASLKYYIEFSWLRDSLHLTIIGGQSNHTCCFYIFAFSSTFQTITEDHKRWLIFGIALNHVLVPSTRSFLEQEIQKEYNNLKARHKIHIQSTRRHLRKYPKFLKYENINNNDKKLSSRGKYDYSSFDWNVTSHVDFAKLYLDNHMAQFKTFDEDCNASAVLNLLGKIPVFSADVQQAADVVRQARNSWAHPTFTDWDEDNFEQKFIDMENFTKKLGLTPVDMNEVLKNLNDWRTKGTNLYLVVMFHSS